MVFSNLFVRLLPFLLSLLFSTTTKNLVNVNAFLSPPVLSPHLRKPSSSSSLITTTVPLFAIITSVDELEKDLTPSERSVTAVVRQASPSIAFVTSVWPGMASSTPTTRRRNNNNNNNNNRTPSGQSLGSGSGFVVSQDGYICTNFHVIERAYTLQKNAAMLESMLDQLAGNVTSLSPMSLLFTPDFVNVTKTFVESQLLPPLPQVYVRINSSTNYQQCRIVDVNTDLDLAVLKLSQHDTSTPTTTDTSPDDIKGNSLLPFIQFGSSSDLLVGQTVVAIGNPFGLDTTVTTGVVSANNREFRAGTARTPANTPIRNVIQTDASINPGNSGGPLLNLKGQVVGINTAIITTSGSSAGIGFAVPADQLSVKVQDIIRQDRQHSLATGQERGWLGVEIVRQPLAVGNGTTTSSTTHQSPLQRLQNWILMVHPDSPAAKAGLQALQFQPRFGTVQFGDAIVAVGGNTVDTFDQLANEWSSRVVGEQVAITVENARGERRVVYVVLGKQP
ncbi:trypsin-like peptidase domain containing protein [Nitzschia inconspicua]|uniref:Trypsin-like peptidase domain containing protein n=1 Tax=Nitzschia inconspicua TaxID=303405 RepID=A0A9K3LIL3_9STRA|nr:trypsin-like peptidase domain containing protein [Nitzschia inconspicua]KAG7362430.1 trypsin-like peptidase domain containing protein [Nitzschia inconspicua]